MKNKLFRCFYRFPVGFSLFFVGFRGLGKLEDIFTRDFYNRIFFFTKFLKTLYKIWQRDWAVIVCPGKTTENKRIPLCLLSLLFNDMFSLFFFGFPYFFSCFFPGKTRKNKDKSGFSKMATVWPRAPAGYAKLRKMITAKKREKPRKI